MLALQREEAVSLLRDCGLANCQKLSNAEMSDRVRTIQEWLDSSGYDGPNEPENKTLLSRLAKATEKGVQVVVCDENEEVCNSSDLTKSTGNGKRAATKNGKDKPVKTKAAVPAAQKNGHSLDAFGNRAGSRLAKINACLTGKSKTMTEIVEEAGLEGTYYSHLRNLINAGHVVKDKNGYRTDVPNLSTGKKLVKKKPVAV